MNKINYLRKIRRKLDRGLPSIGGWMQIPNGCVAEIMGAAGYDWIVVDMEHGSIGVNNLPDLFRSIELGNTLPFARVADGTAKECKQALDAGAAGIIVPNIQDSDQIIAARDACRWPPAGRRGVGFCRANLYGGNFRNYAREAQSPFLVAMLEDVRAIDNLDSILRVDGLDAVLLGPYDLSASLNQTAKFNHPKYLHVMKTIVKKTNAHSIPVGIHVVEPSVRELNKKIKQGFQFLPFSIDTVLLRNNIGKIIK